MEKIFIILILLTPLIILPHMQLGWEVGKVFWIWTVVQGWVVYRLCTKQKIWNNNYLWHTALLWLAVMLISSQLSGGDSFWGGWWRRQGWWFMAHLALLWSLVATTTVNKKWITKAMLAVGFMTLIIGMAQSGRLEASVFEPNGVGLVAALVLVIAANLSRGWIGVVAAIGLVVTQSRAAILAALVVVNKMPRKLLFLAVIVFGAIFLVSTASRGTGERLQVWQDSINIWSTSPWIGIGLDNYYAAYTQMMKIRGIELVKFDQPHNLVLWLLLSVGSLGTAVFAGWIYLIFSKSGYKLGSQLAGAIIIFGLFQPLSTVAWVYLFIVLAICID